ncbi:hypothetical protein AcV5_010023 [Taiwanofungus camphoratus]|nr:hypothetical protein AcV5_010023 [Antrodia cinnamomea]
MQSSQKVWFITGTSSGFGKRLVASVLARGDCVIATVRRPEDFPLTDVDESRVHVLVLDVTDKAENIQGKVNEALHIWGRIDVLVNNAGYAPKALLEEGGSAAALAVFQVNVFGLINVTNAVLPHMRERRSGTLVFLGSRSVWKADTVMTGFYIASKAAVHSLGETYSAELAQFGVRVLVFSPGAFRTENVHTAPYLMNSRIPAYDAFREAALEDFRNRWSRPKGDPAKAMELLVNVVRGEVDAQGRDLPLVLPIGNPTYAAARAHCETLQQTMDAWEDVAKDLDFDADE